MTSNKKQPRTIVSFGEGEDLPLATQLDYVRFNKLSKRERTGPYGTLEVQVIDGQVINSLKKPSIFVRLLNKLFG